MFAGIYMWVDSNYKYDDCGLGEPGSPIEWGTAFAFSLETCTTVGCKYRLMQGQIRAHKDVLLFSSHLFSSFLHWVVVPQTDCRDLPTPFSNRNALPFKSPYSFK